MKKVFILVLFMVATTGCQQQNIEDAQSGISEAIEETDSQVTAVSNQLDQQVTMLVPTMHCPFACYPAVKEALEEQEGVIAVDLVDQKQEAVIDDPRVILTLSDEFDSKQAVAVLSEIGFANAEVTSEP